MKVKRYEKSVGPGPIPNTEREKAILNRAAEDINRAGAAIGGSLDKIAQVIVTTMDERKKKRQQTELVNLRVEQERLFLDEKAKYDQNPNIDTYTKDVEEIYDGATERARASTRDEEVLRLFHQNTQVHKLDMLRRAHNQYLDLFGRRQIADKMVQIEHFKKQAADEIDPITQRTHVENMIVVIRSMNWELGADKAQELEKNTMRDLDRALIERGRLFNATETLKALRAGGFPNLDPRDRSYYDEKLQERIEELKVKAENEQTDVIIKTLEKEYGRDYGMIDLMLGSQDYLRDRFGPDVSAKSVGAARSWFEAKRQAQENIRNGVHKQTMQKFSALYGSGKLTIEMVTDALQRDLLPGPTGAGWINTLQNPPDIQTDYSTYLDLRAKILDSDGSPESSRLLGTQVLRATLSRGDRTKLIDLLYREMTKTEREGMKFAHNYLRDSGIVPKRGIYAKVYATPTEMKDLYDAEHEFDELVKKRDKEKKPITPAEMYEEAKKISLRYIKPEHVRQQEYMEYIKGSAKKPGKNKRQQKETIEEYEERMRKK